MTRSIITGGTGFVGANLARRLLVEGHEVHLLARPSHAEWRIEEIKREVALHTVDLRDKESLESTVKAIRPERVFHLAAYGAYPSQADVHKMVATNITGTINLVEACLKAGFEAFVNTGTSSEYGFKAFAPKEDELLEPNSDYAVTKAGATLFCSHLARKHKANLCTLRLYSVYGPYEEPSRLIPALIMRGLDGELPPLADPDSAHDFVYVDDVCDAYIMAAARPVEEHGAIYNVGTGRQTTLREAVDTARRLMAITVEPEWNSMPERPWDTKSWKADNSRIKGALGWRPRHSFEEGFRKTLDWFREHAEIRELYTRVLKKRDARAHP